MNHDEDDKSAATGDDVPAESAVGEIDLGRMPALGRRARLLAGLTSVAAAAILVTVPPDTDTGTITHTGPISLG